MLLSLLIGRLWWQKRRAASENKLQSVDPIPAFTDDLSDVDNDIDLTIIPPPSLMTELTSLGPASSASSSDALRYNTARNGTIRRQDESDNHPRSFMRNGNNHYYYGWPTSNNNNYDIFSSNSLRQFTRLAEFPGESFRVGSLILQLLTENYDSLNSYMWMESKLFKWIGINVNGFEFVRMNWIAYLFCIKHWKRRNWL